MTEHFCVLENVELGRYAVASKNLKAGEIFLEETPYAYGPKPDSDIVCLECCAPTESRCNICGWPLCSECGAKVHRLECDLFSNHEIKFQASVNKNGACAQLDCITPLRVLLTKDKDLERWTKEVEPMESHDEERRKSKLYEIDQNNVVNYLIKHCKCNYSEELIQKVLGILEVNAFEARTGSGYNIRVLYPKLAILAHSCVPNTTHTTFITEDYKMVARVTVDVEEGQDLYSTYTYTTYGTIQRQYHLKEGKFFVCHCKRCLDPTELGTNFSTLKCSKCDNGWVLPQNPIDPEKTWNCTVCKFTTSASAVSKAVETLQTELDGLNNMGFTAQRLEALEAFMKKYRGILHPRHHILITAKQNLIQLYGRVPGYEMAELPDLMLERLLEFCQDILKVLDVVEPGMSRGRGTLLFTMHVPMMLLAQSLFIHGLLEGEELKKRLKAAADVLEESCNIMELGDPNSSEGMLAMSAVQGLQQLKMSIQQL